MSGGGLSHLASVEAEELYERARALAPEARSAFLAEACAGDSRLEAELRSLLLRAEPAEAFFAGLAESLRSPAAGHQVGRYTLIGTLGYGGMGRVYRARDTRLNRDVALKFLPPHLSADPEFRERLLLEARAAAVLEHPNVCSVHEIGETDEGRPFIAMACYEGETIKQRLVRGPLPAAEAVEVAAQIARGLAAAHARGIVHRDVKPGNVMLCADGTVRLLDFGLAKVADVTLTGPGATPGTVAYMSPEQARGDSVDHRSDLWSLGVVLYEMVTGGRPFRGGNDQALLQAIQHDDPLPITGSPLGIPARLEQVVERLLEKAPADRYESAVALQTDLAEVFTSPARPARRPRSSRRRLVFLVGIGLAVLGAGAAALWRGARDAPSITDSRAAIAVLPFTYRGSPRFGYLGEGLVDLLSTKLEGAPGLRPVDSRTLLKFASREGVITDPQRGALVARRFDAGLFVLGSITEAGGRLGVSATIYDARGRARNSFEAMGRGEEEIFDLTDRLARQILAEVQDQPLQFARIAGQSTTSLPALKAYLEGEREGRAGRVETAREGFQRAVELDTSFALAYYRLAEFSGDTEMVNRALRHSDRLGEFHRRLLLAMAAWVRGDHTSADQQYREILAAHPDDAEAWLKLGDLTMSKGHLLARAWVDAREPFERALALDPGSARSVWWLAAIAAREGRLTDLDSLTDRLLRLNPHPFWASTARGERAFALGDTAGEARYVADLRKRPDQWAHEGAGLVAWTTGNLSAGRRLWGLITEPSRSLGKRLLAHVILAKIKLTGGRWRAAQAELDTAGTMDAGAGLEHRAFYALTRFLSVPDSELIVLRDSLRRWDPSRQWRRGTGCFRTIEACTPISGCICWDG